MNQDEKRGVDLAVERAGSQGKLAASLGISQQAVGKSVSRGYFSITRAYQVGQVTGVPVRDLIDPRVVRAADLDDQDLCACAAREAE